MKREIIESLATLKYEQCLDTAQTFIGIASQVEKIWSNIDEQISPKDIKRRAVGFVINVVISALRDAMKIGLGQRDSLINSDQKPIIEKLAGRFDSEPAAEKITDCFENIRWLEASVNEKLLFEQLLLNLADSATIRV